MDQEQQKHVVMRTPPPLEPAPPLPQAAPERPEHVSEPLWTGPEFVERVDELIRAAGAEPEGSTGRMVREMVITTLKLARDGRDMGEVKLMASALKEMRHAYRVFSRYAGTRKISIFGSARTPEDHRDYKAAVVYSRLMAAEGWLAITGAGDGIMKAGHEGPGRESSFGLSIRLPFETNANTIIAGDSKLINFRYFFTRKLMFVSQSDAVAVFPGGFGTQDELFEVLTLVQTGKAAIVPIVLVEGEEGRYWRHWLEYVQDSLLGLGFISPEDLNLFRICDSPEEAVEHVCRFYRTYHSSRYVRDTLVLRLNRPLRESDVDRLNEEFKPLVKEGRIAQRGPFEVETDHLSLPRLAFVHTRRAFGLVRRLIDRINEFEPAESGPA